MATFTATPTEDRRPIRTFRDLKVWEKAFQLAADIHRWAAGMTAPAPDSLRHGLQEAAVAMTTQKIYP